MIEYSKVLGYKLVLSKYTFDTSYIYVNKTQNNITLTTSKNDGRNCESCSVELTHEQAKELAALLLKMTE